MAHTDKISEKDRRLIAEEIGALIWDNIADSPELAAAPVQLGESFSLWMVMADAFQKGKVRGDFPDLQRLVKDTGRWHHQIKIGGKPKAFARSTAAAGGVGPFSIEELFMSSLAESIG